MDTVAQRKMRHLMQIIIADVEIGRLSQSEDEEERYEEGSRGTFEGFASEDKPNEYDDFEWSIDVLREEMIVGGDDEDALEEAGFERDSSGRLIGRPVSNDLFRNEEEEGPPPGQMKRLVVVTVRMISEDADNDRSYSMMTYLPSPDEELRQIAGGEAAPGEGGGPPAPGGQGGVDLRGGQGQGAQQGGGDRK